MDPHLQKIKFLLNLSKSSEPNEAAAAKAMAEKLIAKHNVTPAQLGEIEASDKPIYSDDNLLHESDTLEDWKNLLALIVAQKYDCYAIQENNVARTGDGVTARQTFRYYVYGEDEDVAVAKELFRFVYDEMDRVIKSRCRPMNRGKVYYDSFCEGLVKGVRDNIEQEDFAVIGVVRQAAPKPVVKADAIAPVEKEARKPPAIENRVKTTTVDEKEIDFMAFIIGESFGKDIHINRNSRPSFRRIESKPASTETAALAKSLEDAFNESDWGNDYDDEELD